MSRSTSRPHPRRGFTLLEVILALSIALGLLTVVLHFHQQAARLRDRTLADSAELAAVRLFMDRLSTELRTAAPRPGSFQGTAQSLEFMRLAFPPPPRAPASLDSAAPSPGGSPLRRIRYRLVGSPAEGTETASGIERTDEPASSVAFAAPAPATIALNPSTPSLDNTVVADLEPASTVAPAPGESARGAIFAGLRYLSLRYWDGSAWLDSWTSPTPPLGVEVNLAVDPPPLTATATPSSTTTATAFPRELFRRVISLPGAGRSLPAHSPDAEDFGL